MAMEAIIRCKQIQHLIEFIELKRRKVSVIGNAIGHANRSMFFPKNFISYTYRY